MAADHRRVPDTLQFSLKRLFAGFPLVAIGLTIVLQLWTYRFPENPNRRDTLGFVLFIAGAMFIGAGLLLPFRRVAIGILLGIAVTVFLVVLLVLM